MLDALSQWKVHEKKTPKKKSKNCQKVLKNTDDDLLPQEWMTQNLVDVMCDECQCAIKENERKFPCKIEILKIAKVLQEKIKKFRKDRSECVTRAVN